MLGIPPMWEFVSRIFGSNTPTVISAKHYLAQNWNQISPQLIPITRPLYQPQSKHHGPTAPRKSTVHGTITI